MPLSFCYATEMARDENLQILLTKDILNPNYYVKALLEDYSGWALTEDKAPEYKGKWREAVFDVPAGAPLDLEIGTGNGTYFAHHAKAYPERCLIGIERKYKPLIQSIRRVRREERTNARMVRFNADYVHQIFADDELDNVYIHFPDPWMKKRKKKNRLINLRFLEGLYLKQKKGSFIEFKTDSHDYFLWAMEFFKASSYSIEFSTEDLHNSEVADENFITTFERIFLNEGIKINYARLFKV